MNGPRWIKQWIADLALLNEQFRNDDGSVDFEALGREEYMFRTALITQKLEKSDRARDIYMKAKAAYDASSENGKKGGRPRKNQETTADGDTREDSLNVTDGSNAALLESGTSAKTFVTTTEATTPCTISADGPRQAEARQSQGRTGAPSTGATSSTAPVRSLPMPTTEQLYDFARAESLDEADARDWYEMTVVDRGGKDRNGNRITNWKAACKKFCVARAQRRTA